MRNRRAKRKEIRRDVGKKTNSEPTNEGKRKMIGIIGIVLSVIGIFLMVMQWNEVKKYILFFPRPMILINYNKTGDGIAILFVNGGSAPAMYFTADISAKNGIFSVGKIHSDFELVTSGQGGSWTIISGRNILPQQKGLVELIAHDKGLTLNIPKLRSDSRHKFIGTFKTRFGPPEETKKENSKKESTL